MPVARHYRFGDFCLDTAERCLLRNGELVPLTPKALETLLFLVEHHGHIVEKQALMDAVWPNTFVEEVSLARNISVLRKIFSDGDGSPSYIETIPKRGYRFVAQVSESSQNGGGIASTPSEGTAEIPPSAVIDSFGVTRGQRRWRSRWIFCTTVTLLFMAVFTYWITSSHPVLSFGNRDWILISDFENHTGDPRFDKALLTALTVSIEQSRYANVAPRSRIYETLKRMGRPQDAATDLTINEALGREICLRENFRALIVTSLTRTGKEYLLIARLVDPKTGADVTSYSRRVQQEDRILDALDSVASNLRHDLGETLYSIRRDDRPLAKVTTSSITALQHYSDGGTLWNHGKYQEAQAQLLEAVQIDPDFAMAHAALGSEFYSHIFSLPKRGKEEYERALALSGRVTDRERMFMEASFAGAQNHAEEAEHAFRGFLESYPDDTRARFDLAGVFLVNGRCNDAIAEYKELIHIDPTDVNSRIRIATCYANEGKYSEAVPYYSRALELDPARLKSNLNHEYGFILAGAGQPERAREIFQSYLEVPEGQSRALRSLGLLNLYEGRYKQASSRFQEAVRVDETDKNDLSAMRDRLYLATTLGEMGERRGELRALDETNTGPLKQIDWLAYRIGVAYARAGALEKANRILSIAQQGGSVDDKESVSDADRLHGEILLANGETTQAVRLLEKAHAENHPPLTILTFDSLGRAYEKSGQPDRAIAAYEAMIAMQGGNPLGWEAQQPWLEDHYRLAEVQAARGNHARAAELLDTLLKIWKNSDPDLPLLEKAQALSENLSH